MSKSARILSGPLQLPGDLDLHHGESRIPSEGVPGDPEERLEGIVRTDGEGLGRLLARPRLLGRPPTQGPHWPFGVVPFAVYRLA